MIKKEMIAMLLAGGQGSRLGVLTSNVAKPAVAFGGKYRIIDFPNMSVTYIRISPLSNTRSSRGPSQVIQVD